VKVEFACVCGAPLDDEGVRLPWRGYLISEADDADLRAVCEAGFREFLAAGTDEARAAWLTRQFGMLWPRGRSDAEYLAEFLRHQLADRVRVVYECTACGRLLIDERTDDTIRLVEYASPGGYRRLLATPVYRHGT
jgi:hypothetical protein